MLEKRQTCTLRSEMPKKGAAIHQPNSKLMGQVTATAGRFSDSNVASASNRGPLELVIYSLKGRFGKW